MPPAEFLIEIACLDAGDRARAFLQIENTVDGLAQDTGNFQAEPHGRVEALLFDGENRLTRDVYFAREIGLSQIPGGAILSNPIF